MRTRVCWLLPDLDSARAAMADLLQSGIDYRDMHFVAREGVNLSGLHEANLLQTSDVIRSAESGLVIGALLGAVLGALVAVHYPIVGEEPQWSLFAALTIAGALFGPWASAMIGVSAPSGLLKRLAPQIEQGRILLMVDVPLRCVAPLQASLRTLRPDAHFVGTEPDLAVLP